jgi:hypothetical protein
MVSAGIPIASTIAPNTGAKTITPAVASNPSSLLQRTVDFSVARLATDSNAATLDTAKYLSSSAKFIATISSVPKDVAIPKDAALVGVSHALSRDSALVGVAGGVSKFASGVSIPLDGAQAIKQWQSKDYDSAIFSGAKAIATAADIAKAPIPASGTVSIVETVYQAGKSYGNHDSLGVASNALLAVSKVAMGSAFALAGATAGPGGAATGFNMGTKTVEFLNASLLAVAQPVADWAVMRYHWY